MRLTAHPLYAGSSIIGVGLAVACRNVAAGALILVYLGVMLTAAIRTEEAFLRARFGEGYDRYRAGATDATRRFSLERAMANHEHRTLVGVLVSIGLLGLRALL